MKQFRRTDKRLSIPVALGLIGVCAIGASLYRGTRDHSPVAPWDYPDPANNYPMAHPGPEMALPSHLIDAQNGVAETPGGIRIKLKYLSKGNTENWGHFWNAQGAPLEESPFYGPQGLTDPPNNLPDQPAAVDGRVRTLAFEVTAKSQANDVSYFAYVPKGAKCGLTPEEQVHHGWDFSPFYQVGHFPLQQKVKVYVDDPSAASLIFALAEGEWKTIDTSKNLMTAKAKSGDVIASGKWGKAIVSRIPGMDVNFAASKSARPAQIVVNLNPLSEPVEQELKLKAFDVSGKEIPIYSKQNVASLPMDAASRIASFEILARPYNLLQFKDLNYDPIPSLWKDIVWGDTQAKQEVKIGEVTVQALALETMRSGDKDWNRQNYVTKQVFTIDGHKWRDHPNNIGEVSSPKTEITPKFDPKTNSFLPLKALPQPCVAVLHFNTGSETPNPAVIRMQLFGSDSTKPGQGLHEEWNLTPLEWNDYGQGRNVMKDFWLSFSLTAKAKTAQLQIEVASGPWEKIGEVTPAANDIKPQGPDYRTYSVELGTKIFAHFMEPQNKWVDRVLSDINVEGKQTRAFARLKSGERKLLTISSYRRNSMEGILHPSFEFDRDATETEGDVIALPDIAAIEIEARSYKTDYLVFTPPKEKQ